MDYLDKIEESKNTHVPISAIWTDTRIVEDVGIQSCIEYYKDYKVIIPPDGYHPEWDLEFRKDPELIRTEAKTELRAGLVRVDSPDPKLRRYTTSFVEYETEGRPSGLSLTKTHFYWFHNDAGTFLVPTDQVRQWKEDINKHSHVKGGVNNDSLGFKLPIAWMLPYQTGTKNTN